MRMSKFIEKYEMKWKTRIYAMMVATCASRVAILVVPLRPPENPFDGCMNFSISGNRLCTVQFDVYRSKR
jgi:hypothetical protein